MEDEVNKPEIIDRNTVTEKLMIELNEIHDVDMPEFFLDTINKYLSEIYDFEATISSFNTDPYTLGETIEVGKDDNGNEICENELILVNDPLSVDEDAKIFWLHSFELHFKNKNLGLRAFSLVDSTFLRTLLVGILFERPDEIFKDTPNPEIDILLNIVCDIVEYNKENHGE